MEKEREKKWKNANSDFQNQPGDLDALFPMNNFEYTRHNVLQNTALYNEVISYFLLS